MRFFSIARRGGECSPSSSGIARQRNRSRRSHELWSNLLFASRYRIFFTNASWLVPSRVDHCAEHRRKFACGRKWGIKEDQAMSFLDRSHTIAKPGFSRWMVPPAALCIHLCIGQAYAFSVFNLPMTKLIGITQSAPDDWKLTELGWIFSIAIFLLGALGRAVRPLGRGRRPAPGDVHRGAVLRRRLPGLRVRRLHPQSLGRLSRLWRARRLRARASATSRRSPR